MPSLWHREAGQGAPLVLLHSGGMASDEWEPHMEGFAKRFRVIAPDLPGHGKSPNMPGGLSVAAMADAVVGLLDDLEIEKAHIVGSSMGGAVALWMGLNHPSRVDRLVLFRIGYRKTPEAAEATAGLADPQRWRRLGMAEWMSRVHAPQGGPDAWVDVIRQVADAFAPGHTDHRHRLDDVADLRAPTLVAVGDRDPFVPLDEVLAMAAAIPDHELWVMPGAGHIVALRTWRAASFVLEVSRFLQRRRAHGSA